MNPADGGSSRGRYGSAVTVARVGVSFAGWKIAVAVAIVIFGLLLGTGLFVASSSSAVGENASCAVKGAEGLEIPANYVPWLEKATAKYKLGPKGFSIVAAIHSIESNFGRSTLPGVSSGENFAGAGGPGQFLGSSWEAYGVDGNGDGIKDRYSIPDSIFATAHYLHVSGAPRDWWNAIFAYNHAGWYVEDVLAKAEGFGTEVVCTPQLGEVPSGSLQKIEYFARWIERKEIPYCWGGGHGTKPGPNTGEKCSYVGLDCSGSVRLLLVLAGYPDPGGITSGEFAWHNAPGIGRYVTIWSNEDHVFISINGRTWGTSSSNPGSGPGYAAHTTTGFTPTHPAEL